MEYKVIIPCLIILSFISITYAGGGIIYDTYTHTATVTGKNSFHETEILLNVLNETQELNLTLPPRIENLRFFIDETETFCDLEEVEEFSMLRCYYPEGIVGKHFIELTYESGYPIFEIQNRILYKSEYILTHPTTQFYYFLKLPKGYIIPEEKDISFFINPKPKNLYSDGQRIILLWEMSDLTSNFELSALIEPGDKSSPSVLAMVVLVSLGLLGGGSFVIFLRKTKKTKITYPALIEHERVIVDLLKKADDNVLWQKQIQHQSGFTKVKVSRILRSLGERGVIKKEPWGNTNKIHLIIEQTPEKGGEEINGEK